MLAPCRSIPVWLRRWLGARCRQFAPEHGHVRHDFSFSGLHSSLSLSGYQLRLWHFAAAAGIAIAAVGLGLLTAVLTGLFRRLAAPLGERVLLRGAMAGFAFGILAMAVPLTLFSGGSTLGATTSQAAEIGAAVLVVSIVAKLAAMTAAQAFGFIGGPIFPLVFAGGVLGAVVNLVVPEIPVELAVAYGTRTTGWSARRRAGGRLRRQSDGTNAAVSQLPSDRHRSCPSVIILALVLLIAFVPLVLLIAFVPLALPWLRRLALLLLLLLTILRLRCLTLRSVLEIALCPFGDRRRRDRVWRW